MSQATLEQIGATLQAAQRILVTTHPDPDGDAAGSVSAAVTALRRLGKDVVAFNPDPIPDRFQFLAGLEDVVSTLPLDPFDVTLLLDCTDDRMFVDGRPSAEYLGRVLALDHHRVGGDLAELAHRDPSAAAAGVVLYRLLGVMQLPIDVTIAEALYCALISDTGSFRYQNTNAESMRVGAELLERGVDPWRVASNLYESKPRGQLELLGLVLPTLETSVDGWVAVLTVTEEMLHRTGCQADHVDGFINFARGLRGVEVATLLRVGGEQGLRVSLRSRGTVDVSEIAVRFGGGGHKNAAGFSSLEPAEAILPQLFECVSACCIAAGCVPASAPSQPAGPNP